MDNSSWSWSPRKAGATRRHFQAHTRRVLSRWGHLRGLLGWGTAHVSLREDPTALRSAAQTRNCGTSPSCGALVICVWGSEGWESPGIQRHSHHPELDGHSVSL